MTHDELVEFGRNLFSPRFKCSIVITEMATPAMDQPESIGRLK